MKICGLKYEQALRYLAEGDAVSIEYDPASDSFSIEPHYREGDYMIAGEHSYYIKIINGRLMRQYFDDECVYFSPGEVSKYVHVRDGHRVEPLKKHPLCKYIYKHIAGEPFMVKIDGMWHNSITLKNEELTFGVDIECKDVGVKFGDVVISRGEAWIVTNARTLFLQFGLGSSTPPDQLVMYKTDPTNASYGICWTADLSGVMEIKKRPIVSSDFGYSFSELNTAINTWAEPVLKVGDVVRVCRHPSGDNMKYNYTEGFDNVWVRSMNEFVSSIARIGKIGKGGIELSSLDASYLFPPSALVKV